MSPLLPARAVDAWLRTLEGRTGRRIGTESPAASGLRLRQRPGFDEEPRAFWHDAGPHGPAELVSGHYGLLAPAGPMPDGLTEAVLHAPDGAEVAAFLDMLVQRLAQLHYRAWARLRPECEARHADDRFLQLLQLLAGGDFFAPHLSSAPPAADALPALAHRLFGLAVQVRRPAVAWQPNPQPIALRQVRLGRQRIGRRVPLGGAQHGSVQLEVLARDAAQYGGLRQPEDGRLRGLLALARQCLGAHATVQLRVVPPRPWPAARLGRSALGRSRLHRPGAAGAPADSLSSP